MDTSDPSARSAAGRWHSPRVGYVAASLGVALLTALTQPLLAWVDPSNLVMLYLLLVVGIALRYSRGPAAWCAASPGLPANRRDA